MAGHPSGRQRHQSVAPVRTVVVVQSSGRGRIGSDSRPA
ncbi:MAG: hypothetical protein AVDCRST_MAG59-607 [uncultured Thermomicrobiales bacterium]|uniref:Uncharacterized protein n=1 Tax=uncultured Thermomicrobiales bacterium TaxID=1645740 RepID=A0A6J4U597_9BACT|nr:MAG: hypothetical protein AVDCRST_MAG59-607 [uncultured Thermomicrobiales bacterium]